MDNHIPKILSPIFFPSLFCTLLCLFFLHLPSLSLSFFPSLTFCLSCCFSFLFSFSLYFHPPLFSLGPQFLLFLYSVFFILFSQQLQYLKGKGKEKGREREVGFSQSTKPLPTCSQTCLKGLSPLCTSLPTSTSNTFQAL